MWRLERRFEARHPEPQAKDLTRNIGKYRLTTRRLPFERDPSAYSGPQDDTVESREIIQHASYRASGDIAEMILHLSHLKS